MKAQKQLARLNTAIQAVHAAKRGCQANDLITLQSIEEVLAEMRERQCMLVDLEQDDPRA